jgi:hypothetical protein
MPKQKYPIITTEYRNHQRQFHDLRIGEEKFNCRRRLQADKHQASGILENAVYNVGTNGSTGTEDRCSSMSVSS